MMTSTYKLTSMELPQTFCSNSTKGCTLAPGMPHHLARTWPPGIQICSLRTSLLQVMSFLAISLVKEPGKEKATEYCILQLIWSEFSQLRQASLRVCFIGTDKLSTAPIFWNELCCKGCSVHQLIGTTF